VLLLIIVAMMSNSNNEKRKEGGREEGILPSREMLGFGETHEERQIMKRKGGDFILTL